jgi:hypothetical protein
MIGFNAGFLARRNPLSATHFFEQYVKPSLSNFCRSHASQCR